MSCSQGSTSWVAAGADSWSTRPKLAAHTLPLFAAESLLQKSASYSSMPRASLALTGGLLFARQSCRPAGHFIGGPMRRELAVLSDPFLR